MTLRQAVWSLTTIVGLVGPTITHAEETTAPAPQCSGPPARIEAAPNELQLVGAVTCELAQAAQQLVEVWHVARCEWLATRRDNLANAARDSLINVKKEIDNYSAAKGVLLDALDEYVLQPDNGEWRARIIPQLKALEREAEALPTALEQVPGYLAIDPATSKQYTKLISKFHLKYSQLQTLEGMTPPSRKHPRSLRELQAIAHRLAAEREILDAASSELGEDVAPGGLSRDGCPEKS